MNPGELPSSCRKTNDIRWGLSYIYINRVAPKTSAPMENFSTVLLEHTLVKIITNNFQRI